MGIASIHVANQRFLWLHVPTERQSIGRALRLRFLLGIPINYDSRQGPRSGNASGLEAAQVILGHAKADVIQVYAERDLDKAEAVMREVG
jgi:hypothetical protein